MPITVRTKNRMKCFIPSSDFCKPATRNQIAQLKGLTGVKEIYISHGSAQVLLNGCFTGKTPSLQGMMEARDFILSQRY